MFGWLLSLVFGLGLGFWSLVFGLGLWSLVLVFSLALVFNLLRLVELALSIIGRLHRPSCLACRVASSCTVRLLSPSQVQNTQLLTTAAEAFEPSRPGLYLSTCPRRRPKQQTRTPPCQAPRTAGFSYRAVPAVPSLFAKDVSTNRQRVEGLTTCAPSLSSTTQAMEPASPMPSGSSLGRK